MNIVAQIFSWPQPKKKTSQKWSVLVLSLGCLQFGGDSADISCWLSRKRSLSRVNQNFPFANKLINRSSDLWRPTRRKFLTTPSSCSGLLNGEAQICSVRNFCSFYVIKMTTSLLYLKNNPIIHHEKGPKKISDVIYCLLLLI